VKVNTVRLNMPFSRIDLICFNYRWHQKYSFLLKCNEPLNNVTYPCVFVDRVGVWVYVCIASLREASIQEF